jgi:hypothetical protein
MLGSFFST